ncbi:MAG TPA: hypothetical protein VGK90_11320, partial [Rhizomicrobium sp.]
MISSQGSIASVPPGGTIGILGGGQLGRMLALAAARLGLKIHIYSDEAGATAFDVATAHTSAPYTDDAALGAFADAVDVITFEFENVPSESLALLEQQKPVFPSSRALAFTQDRLTEKDFVAGLGVATARYAPADTRED